MPGPSSDSKKSVRIAVVAPIASSPASTFIMAPSASSSNAAAATDGVIIVGSPAGPSTQAQKKASALVGTHKINSSGGGDGSGGNDMNSNEMDQSKARTAGLMSGGAIAGIAAAVVVIVAAVAIKKRCAPASE